METLLSKIKTIDLEALTEGLHQNGYVTLRGILTADQCDELKKNYDHPEMYRKTILMERYRFGSGEYKYFDYPLPNIIALLRENIYSLLVPIANHWMKVLGIPVVYPTEHQELLHLCHKKGQARPTPLILKYHEGGFNTLHQDLYGEVFFPIQMVVFLSEPEKDFTGGEFVLTQQNIRAQSKAIVLQPKKGDILVFTTNYRPVKGSKGYFKANMKHGVSEIRSGERYTLGIIFHDALT